jgi:Sulfite exporter TauE/SafE
MTPFPAETLALMAAGGGLVGFLVGLTGVGAGALLTPMLISGFGVSPAVAVGTDLLFASLTKATAAVKHHKLGNVNWSILKWPATGSLTAALATLAWLFVTIPDTQRLSDVIRGLLAILLIISAVIIPLCPWVLRDARKHADAQHVPVHRLNTVVTGLILGVLVTLTSVGAGAIGVRGRSFRALSWPDGPQDRWHGHRSRNPAGFCFRAGAPRPRQRRLADSGCTSIRLDPRNSTRHASHGQSARLDASLAARGRPPLRSLSPAAISAQNGGLIAMPVAY